MKEALKPEFQNYIGQMSESEIAQYIGYNLVVNACTLTQIDGFADRDDNEARAVGRTDCYVERVTNTPRKSRNLLKEIGA